MIKTRTRLTTYLLLCIFALGIVQCGSTGTSGAVDVGIQDLNETELDWLAAKGMEIGASALVLRMALTFLDSDLFCPLSPRFRPPDWSEA